jgi:hypothetical protein
VGLPSPAAGATNVAGSAISATFNEPMDATTMTTATFELLGPGGVPLPGTVSYNAATRTVTLQPTAPLAASTVHTGRVRGGAADPRVKDSAGNALAANFTWTFTTSGAPANEGPGGPVLVIASTINPFGRYLGEILRAEGLNLFTVTDISLVTAGTLSAYDVVVLGDLPLTSAEVTMFTTWVEGGGKLIAMRPDKQLATLAGLTDAGATLSNQYLLIAQSGPGTGLVNQTIQFHGTADRYTLSGATALATLYSNATTATPNPAVTLRSVGSNGGQVATFAFDLARSVVYTRQGNPAWSGQERDNLGPIRSDDLFYGAAANDPQPDWVNLDKVAIPQADEQQRLFANLILQMNQSRKPLPRFWYLPRGLKAAVVMTGDDHATGGTAGRFDAYKLASPAGCSVADWQCIRGTSYIYPDSPLSSAQALAYTADGFEIGVHITTNCDNYTSATLDSVFATQLAQFASEYPGIPAPSTNRTHCIVWSDYSTQPAVELGRGIRFDTNYYYWPGAWILDRPGVFTGSGFPMRFARADGSTINVYQATTQLTDESLQTYQLHVDTLLNRALGLEGYFGVFTANMHTDDVAHAGSDAIVASATARGVPIVSAKQMLTWLDGRNDSAFSSIAWSEASGTLTFTVTQGTGANGLQGMIPAQTAPGPLVALTRGGTAVPFTVQTIKGVSYAMFTAVGGAHTAVYMVPANTTITSAAPSPTSASASFTFTATPAAGATFQCALDAAPFATCTSPQPYTGLAVGSHTFQVRAVNAAGPDATPASVTWTITLPPDTSIVTTPANPTTNTSASFTFTATPSAGATFQCAMDAAPFATCTSPQNYTGLAVGSHTFQVRAVNTAGPDATPASFTWTISGTAPETAITSSPSNPTTSTSASFTFTATPSAGATFQCALDAAAFATCTSPRNLTGLAVGSHTFQVRAVNASGTDATPASFTWTINAGAPAGPVAAYGFEETTGTTTEDSSGLGNTGTLSNATRVATGRFGRALSFNGTNAWVTVADSASLDLTNAMTIEAWINPTAANEWDTLVMKESATGLAYALYVIDQARPAGYVRVGANDVGAVGTAMAANTWVHVAMTYDGTTLRFYRNGTQVATAAASGAVSATTGALRIGGNSPWGDYFSGMIDEVRVYNRVLTAAEITTDMNTAVKP